MMTMVAVEKILREVAATLVAAGEGLTLCHKLLSHHQSRIKKLEARVKKLEERG